MGSKYNLEIEINSRPKGEYLTDDYFALDLPVAPAIMVGEEIVVEGRDIDDHTLKSAICRHLGLPEPEPEEHPGIMARLFSRP